MCSWKFARRPFWLFSHVFAASIVVLFVFLGLWQLDRLDQRRAQNDLILLRTEMKPSTISDLLSEPLDQLEFRRFADRGRFISDDLVRIGSQTQDGSAGDHVVGIFELEDGTQLAVNRGYVPLAALDQLTPAGNGEVELVGWVRLDQSKEGIFGAPDGQTSERIPRFNIQTISDRVDGDLAPVWLQSNPDAAGSELSNTGTFPAPVPLPPLDEGNHFSYAVQWFIFASLGAAVYAVLLRSVARSEVVAGGSVPRKPSIG